MPLILTCLSAIGTAAAAVLAACETPIALQKVADAEKKKDAALTKKEIVTAAAPSYIPAIAVGLSAIGCVFGANHLNWRQQASLASAYALLDILYKEYKDKVVRIIGDEADRTVEKAIELDHEPGRAPVLWDEPQTFYEEHYGKFFERTMEEVFTAEYCLNRNFAIRGYVTINDFYDLLKLPHIEDGDKIGWSLEAGVVVYGYSWIDFTNKTFTMDDGLECVTIGMPFEPTEDFMEPEGS